MNWLVLSALCVFAASIATLYQRVIMKDADSEPVSYAIAFQIILTVVTAIFAVFHGFQMPPLTQFPLYFALSAVCYGVGTLFMFQAFHYLEASEASIIFCTGTIVSIVGSVMFLGETMTGVQVLGVLLILGSVFLVNGNMKWKLNKGVWYAFGVALFYGIAIISDTVILKQYDVFSYVPVMSILPVLVIILLRPRAIGGLARFADLSLLKNMCILGFFYGIQAIAYYSAVVGGGGVSRVATVTRATTIVTVILAIIFLNERKHLWYKLAAAAMVTAGVFLLR